MKADSIKVVIFAFLANLSIAAAKFIVSFITHSSALLSEAIHSLADTGNQILLLIGLKRSLKKEDKIHPFGYNREQYFWSFLVAVMLFLLGGLYSLSEGIKKLVHSHKIEEPWVAIGVLLFSLIAEGFSFLKAKKEIHKSRKNSSLIELLKNCYKAELLVVFFEDSAAITGITIALISTLLYILTKNSIFDSIGSILIGMLLIIVSIGLGAKMKSLIVGRAAPSYIIKNIVDILESTEGIEKVAQVKTMVLGSDSILAAIEVIFKDGLDIDYIDDKIKEIEKRIKSKHSEVKNIYIEPKESS